MPHLKCPECRKIGTELAHAFCDAWISSDSRSREVFQAMRNLIGGTEEDFIPFEELLPGTRIKGSERIGVAIGMKLAHEAFSGHKVPVGPF